MDEWGGTPHTTQKVPKHSTRTHKLIARNADTYHTNWLEIHIHRLAHASHTAHRCFAFCAVRGSSPPWGYTCTHTNTCNTCTCTCTHMHKHIKLLAPNEAQPREQV